MARTDKKNAKSGLQSGGAGRVLDWLLMVTCLISTLIGTVALFVLLFYVVIDSIGWLDYQFLTSFPSSLYPEKAGFKPAIVGTVFMVALLIPMSLVLGIGAAVYLTEYARPSWFTKFVNINIANLAGVPSIVWGLLGMGLFVTILGLEAGTVLLAAMTMSLLILPVIIISSMEAIKAVPDSLRDASYGMGATQWQTIRRVVLPKAFPGILTGTILSLARAMGETAPLIMIGVPSFVMDVPTQPTDKFTSMTMQIYRWADYADPAFKKGVAAAGVVTLLIVMLALNAVAIFLRNKFQSQD